jgi:hypothetical protein
MFARQTEKSDSRMLIGYDEAQGTFQAIFPVELLHCSYSMTFDRPSRILNVCSYTIETEFMLEIICASAAAVLDYAINPACALMYVQSAATP